MSGYEKPVIVSGKELKSGLLTGSRKDIYLYVDITGLKCIDRKTKVGSSAAGPGPPAHAHDDEAELLRCGRLPLPFKVLGTLTSILILR